MQGPKALPAGDGLDAGKVDAIGPLNAVNGQHENQGPFLAVCIAVDTAREVIHFWDVGQRGFDSGKKVKRFHVFSLRDDAPTWLFFCF